MKTETTLSKKSKPCADKEKLFAIYKDEPILHQKLLQVKALLFFMQTKGDFINGLSRSTLRAHDGKKFNSSNLNPILEQLKKKKLLMEDFNCNPIILHEITRDAIGAHNPDTN